VVRMNVPREAAEGGGRLVDVDLGNVFSAEVRKQQEVVQNCSLDRRTSRHRSVGSGDPPLVPERGGAVPFVAIAADRGCVYTATSVDLRRAAIPRPAPPARASNDECAFSHL
jgi:hypothetical protein